MVDIEQRDAALRAIEARKVSMYFGVGGRRSLRVRIGGPRSAAVEALLRDGLATYGRRRPITDDWDWESEADVLLTEAGKKELRDA